MLLDLTNNNKFPYEVYIRKNIFEELNIEYSQSLLFEVGGIIFGRKISDSKKIYIDKIERIISENKFHNSYERNSKIAQQLINEVWKESCGYLNYLGEWHSHPKMRAWPSVKDYKTIVSLTKEKESSLFPYTIMMIIGLDKEVTVTIVNRKEVITCINILN